MVTFWDTVALIFNGYLFIQGSLNIEKLNLSFYAIIFCLILISDYCSIWHLSVTALERMCFVVWPTNATIRRASVKEALVISFGFILFAVLLSLFPIVLIQFLVKFTCWLLLIFAIIIPFIILFSSSFILLYKLNKDSKNINPLPQNQVSVSTLLSIKWLLLYRFIIF